MIRLSLFFGTSISLFFIPWAIIKAWLAPLPDSIQEQLQKTTQYGFDGVIVYINQTGKEPEFYSAGWKNSEQKIPADPHSLFKIASIGKLYHAVSIAKLASANKISLDKSLAYYFPELVGRIEYADKITIRMLVKHRSGIPNYINDSTFWTDPPKNSEETLARVLDLPANYKPDASYEYSNTNYLLLSNLIEKVTQKSTFAYIKESILNPLNLIHTFGSIHDVNPDDVMSGYYVGYDEDTKLTNYGSMLATAEDVGLFLRALNDGSVFDSDKEKELYASIYTFEHTGLIVGYQSIAKYHKDIDAVVIQFTNTTNFDGYNWNLSEIGYNRVVKILRRKS